MSQVQPSPVALSWQFGRAQTNDGKHFLTVVIHDPTGAKCLFMERGAAIDFFTQGLQSAQAIGSGLIVPAAMTPSTLRG